MLWVIIIFYSEYIYKQETTYNRYNK